MTATSVRSAADHRAGRPAGQLLPALQEEAEAAGLPERPRRVSVGHVSGAPPAVPGALLAPPRRRSHPVWRVPRLQDAARSTGRVLRAGPPGAGRRGRDGIVLLTYGRSSGYCIDPVEKKPLDHYLRLVGPVVRHRGLQPGLPGFCQNWDISSRRRWTRWPTPPPRRPSPRQRCGSAPRRGVHLQRPDHLPGVRQRRRRHCHEVGVGAIAVTAGYICPEPRRDFYAHLDALNVDLKGFCDDFYRHVCGGRLEPVLDHAGVPAPRDRPVVRGHDPAHPREERRRRGARPADLVDGGAPGARRPLHFTAFHPDFKMTDIARTPPATLTRAREWGLRNGLRPSTRTSTTGPGRARGARGAAPC